MFRHTSDVAGGARAALRLEEREHGEPITCQNVRGDATDALHILYTHSASCGATLEGKLLYSEKESLNSHSRTVKKPEAETDTKYSEQKKSCS